jgi:hypothetical protein
LNGTISTSGRIVRRAAFLVALLGLLATTGPAAGAERARAKPTTSSRGGSLHIYYRSPVLVRAGERALIPVDVSCATASGRACSATVTLRTDASTPAWRAFGARARPDLRFDLTRPAARVSRAVGSVAFAVGARDAEGRSISLPSAGALRLYVTRHMRSVAIASAAAPPPQGQEVLYLPWGSGAYRAGLAPGNESATMGPSAFDVDERGRIYLMDSLQKRVAIFGGSRLVREIRADVMPRADVAVAGDGTVYIGTASPSDEGEVTVQAFSRTGGSSGPSSIGEGILSELRAPGNAASAHLLPLDAWVPASPAAGAAAGITKSRIDAGQRLASGDLLLASMVGRSVRLGTVRGGRVTRAVELRLDGSALSEIALAAPDGHGGYWTVVHTADDSDQFQVVHVTGDGSAATFSVPDSEFAEAMPLAKFRIGRDGDLYHLITSPDGMRIIRYDIGGES